MSDLDSATFSATVFDEADCLVLRDALEHYRVLSRRSLNTPPISHPERLAGRQVLESIDRMLRSIPAPVARPGGCLAHSVARSRRH